MKTPEKDSEHTKNTEVPMAPNTQERKGCFTDDLANYMKKLKLTQGDDQLEMITSLLKKLGMYEKNTFEQKPITAGRKLASVETTQQI